MIVSLTPQPFCCKLVKSRDGTQNLDRVLRMKQGCAGGPRLCSTGAFITVDKRDSAGTVLEINAAALNLLTILGDPDGIGISVHLRFTALHLAICCRLIVAKTRIFTRL